MGNLDEVSDPRNRIWQMRETHLLAMLERVQAGEDPQMVLISEFANSDSRKHGENCECALCEEWSNG